MSLSLNPIIPVRAMDPALDFNDNRFYSVTTGAEMVSYKPIMSTSFSNSSLSFTCPPPSPLIAVHNKVYISVPMLLNFSVDPAVVDGSRILQDGRGALRAFCLENIIQTATARINNNTNNVSYSDIIPYVLRYNTSYHEKEYQYSCCPSYMDTNFFYENASGDAINPLASYGEVAYATPRGAFPYIAVNNPATVNDPDPALRRLSAQIQCVVTSPIWISPFGFGDNGDNKCALIGVSTMDFIFTLANLQRVWSSVLGEINGTAPGDGLAALPANPYTALTVTLGQPAMLFRYLSPKLLQSIPRSLTYSYTMLDRYPSAQMAIAANSSKLITSNNIQLNTIPRRIYVFARRSNDSVQTGYTRTIGANVIALSAVSAMINTTDTFLPINSLEINYNNNSGLLSSATPYDLWVMSSKNGVNISWPAWCGQSILDPTAAYPVAGITSAPTIETTGSPLQFVGTNGKGYVRDFNIGSIVAVDFGVDVGLSDIHAPDQIFNSQLFIRANFTNPTPDEMNITMYIITCTSGTLTIENLQAIANIGVLSKEDVVNARQQDGVVYHSKHSIYGGDLSSSLKKFGKQAVSAVKSAVPYVKKGIQGVSKAADYAGKAVDTVEGLAGLVGLGYQGGVNSGGAYAGGIATGGRRITRSELQHRLGM